MHRHKLINQLEEYRVTFPQENEKVDQILEFVRTYANCFDRELSVGHITASAWLENHTGDMALLGLHKKLGIWTQLGGHADGESDTLGVAIKEAQEESGIDQIEPVKEDIFDIDIHFIPARPGESGHYHYDIRYHLRVTQDVKHSVNDELHELKWITPLVIKELPQLDDSIIRMVKKWSKQ